MQSELVRQLYKPDEMDDLLAETEDMAQRRRDTLETMKVFGLLFDWIRHNLLFSGPPTSQRDHQRSERNTSLVIFPSNNFQLF